MNIEKYTEKAQEILQSAQASRQGAPTSGWTGTSSPCPASADDGLIPRLVIFMGENLASVEESVEAELNKLPRVEGQGASDLYATRRFNKILLDAEDEAEKFKDDYVSVEHLYLALLGERATPSSNIFRKYNINREDS